MPTFANPGTNVSEPQAQLWGNTFGAESERRRGLGGYNTHSEWVVEIFNA